MSWLHTIIIAIVEGITEFLPISSTGHMIITQHLLGVPSSEFVNLFLVSIQFGAILSVLVLYWKKFLKSFKFYTLLLVAFIPAAIIGFLLGDQIDLLLENIWVVAISLIVGGVVLIFVDKWFSSSRQESDPSFKQAFFIGCFQIIAMIPGVSRSAVTIIGGMQQKLTRKNAAEFSFFLAVPTMFAASAYKLLKTYKVIEPEHIKLLVVGNAIAFVVAMGAIKFFVDFLVKHGFKYFGYYRIAIGLTILVLLWLGFDLKIV